MKKYLVCVGIGSDVYKDKLAAVNVEMPDEYDPINDNPSDDNGYPELKKAVYEYKRKSNTYGKEEYIKFDPEKISIMAITYLGKVRGESVTSSGTFDAARIMGGEKSSEKETTNAKANPKLKIRFRDGYDLFTDVIAYLGEYTARSCRVVVNQTSNLGDHWLITLRAPDKSTGHIVDDRVTEMHDRYTDSGRRVMFNVLVGEYEVGDIHLVDPE